MKPFWTRRPKSISAAARPQPYRRARLGVEALEDRCVPATFIVNSNGDTAAPPAGTVTLRSAITQAEADATPDTINFAASLTGQTITLTAALPTLTKGETITGLGAASLSVSGANAFRVFNVTSATLVTISGLTVTGGNVAGAAGNGGGVLDTGGVLTLDKVTLSGNTATGPRGGGGIFITGGTALVTISNSTVASNTAFSGGGIFADFTTTTTITGTTVTSNTGTTGGFGAGILNEGTMTLTNTTVSLNNGTGGAYSGAGISNFGSLSLVGTSVIGNVSQGSGGGIDSVGTLVTITNSTIANNTSLGGAGGGIRIGAGPLTLLNDTITNNIDASGAATNAGGVAFAGATFTTSNTIIALNFATGAAAPPDVRGTVAGGSVNNFIGIGDAALTGITNGTAGNQIGTTATPKNPLLGPLQNNGGPTFSRVPLLGSPVINAGNNAASGTLTADQRGFVRTVTNTVDIGAVEFQPKQVSVVLAVAPGTPTPFRLPLTLTATVTAAPTSVGANNVLTGTVTFLNGSTVLGTAPVDATGKATLTLKPDAPLPAGTDALTARYEGDFNYGPGISPVVNQVVSIRKTTPGVYDSTAAKFFLRNTNSAGPVDVPAFQYGAPGADTFPIVGDWNGTGVFTVGVFTRSTATFQIRFSNTPGPADVTFSFGRVGVGIPVAGDWDGDGKWTVGVFDPTTGNWNLRNSLSGGLPDAGSFLYGSPGSKPVVGDWNGSGSFHIGVIEPDGTWKLKNNNTTGTPDFTFMYGSLSDTPIVGDWNGDGVWTPGVVDASGIWKLRNSNSGGAPDITPFQYGGPGTIPVPGSFVFPSL